MENKKETTLTLNEVYELESELNGFSHEGKKIFDGLLNQKTSFVVKYHLKKLYQLVKVEKDLIDELKNDLIKKYGTEREDGTIVIEPRVKVSETVDNGEDVEKFVVNQKFLEFQKEFNNILEQSKTIEHHAFVIDDFSNIETDDNYTVFYKLLD